MSTAEKLSPVPSPSITSGDTGSSPVPTFAEATDEKPKRKTARRKSTSRRKTSKRKTARRKTAEASESAPKRSRRTSKRKTSRRKQAARRVAPAPVKDATIEAVIEAKRAELKELDKRAKLLEKQVAALEKML